MAVILDIRVTPRASKNAWKVGPDGRLRCSLTAPPVDGKANEALIGLVSKACFVPKRAVSIVSGLSSRDKRLAVETELSKGEVLACLGIEEQLRCIS
jgi:uncharacterized protein